MKTVTLEVATLQEVKRRAQSALTGRKQGARISFATPELLFQVMTAKRWELLRTMTRAEGRPRRPLLNRINDSGRSFLNGSMVSLTRFRLLTTDSFRQSYRSQDARAYRLLANFSSRFLTSVSQREPRGSMMCNARRLPYRSGGMDRDLRKSPPASEAAQPAGHPSSSSQVRAAAIP